MGEIVRIGQLVKVNYDEEGEWVDGKIVRVNHTTRKPTYDVLYVTGEVGKCVAAKHIIPDVRMGNETQYIHKVFIPLPQPKVVKYLPGLAAKRIPPRSQTLFHVPSMRPGRENSAETFFANRRDAMKAWKDTLPKKPVSLMDAHFAIVRQPPEEWFVTRGQEEQGFDVSVQLRTRYDEIFVGSLELNVVLAYENLMRVDDQCILKVLSTKSMCLLKKKIDLRVSVEEPSEWPAHRNRRFVLVVSTKNVLRGEAIANVTTTPFRVRTKTVAVVKRELAKRGLYSSATTFHGDKQRFRYLGKVQLTSTTVRDMSPYEQRKIVLQQTLRRALQVERRKKKANGEENEGGAPAPSTFRRRHMTGAARLSFLRRANLARGTNRTPTSRRCERSSRRSNDYDGGEDDDTFTTSNKSDKSAFGKGNRRVRSRQRRRRRISDGKATTKSAPVRDTTDDDVDDDLLKAKTRVPCPALDILRSIRSMLPPIDDVLQEARERDEKRVEAPPNEWKKSDRLFNAPYELELGKFYAARGEYRRARRYYRRAADLLTDVFGDADCRVASAMIYVSKQHSMLGCLELSVATAKKATRIMRTAFAEDSLQVCESVDALRVALVRARRYDEAIALLSRHCNDIADLHERSIESKDTNRTLRCLNERSASSTRLDAVRQLRERRDMRACDERVRYEEMCDMFAHDLRMTPEQQQIVATLKMLRDARGFEMLEVFATRSEGNFRVKFWREVQEFKELASGSQEFAEKVRRIYEIFIVPRSALPVITNEMREDIHSALDIDSDVSITRFIYEQAESLVLSNIAFEIVPDFAETAEGRTYLQQRRDLNISWISKRGRRRKSESSLASRILSSLARAKGKGGKKKKEEEAVVSEDGYTTDSTTDTTTTSDEEGEEEYEWDDQRT